MSILIKDMKMPEACDDCPFHVYHSHYKYVCKATPMFYPMNLANSKGIRKDWCPLLEVPERKTGRWIPCGKCIHADGKHRWCKILDRSINEDYFCYWAESFRKEGEADG